MSISLLRGVVGDSWKRGDVKRIFNKKKLETWPPGYEIGMLDLALPMSIPSKIVRVTLHEGAEPAGASAWLLVVPVLPVKLFWARRWHRMRRESGR